jgi:hypothetical protein
MTLCNCSACDVPPEPGLQKSANSSTLIKGLAQVWPDRE